MGSPTGRATDAVMILGEGGAMLMFSPSRRFPGIQYLPGPQRQDCRRVGRLPQSLWRLTWTVVAVSWIQALFWYLDRWGKPVCIAALCGPRAMDAQAPTRWGAQLHDQRRRH